MKQVDLEEYGFWFKIRSLGLQNTDFELSNLACLNHDSFWSQEKPEYLNWNPCQEENGASSGISCLDLWGKCKKIILFCPLTELKFRWRNDQDSCDFNIKSAENPYHFWAKILQSAKIPMLFCVNMHKPVHHDWWNSNFGVICIGLQFCWYFASNNLLCADVKMVEDHCYKPGHFRCREGRYIPEEYLCDGFFNDCNDNYDESDELCVGKHVHLMNWDKFIFSHCCERKKEEKGKLSFVLSYTCRIYRVSKKNSAIVTWAPFCKILNNFEN